MHPSLAENPIECFHIYAIIYILSLILSPKDHIHDFKIKVVGFARSIKLHLCSSDSSGIVGGKICNCQHKCCIYDQESTIEKTFTRVKYLSEPIKNSCLSKIHKQTRQNCYSSIFKEEVALHLKTSTWK